MALITCEHVCLGYDGQTVLRDVNFTVSRGDLLCVVGENGSGKSTLIKGLLGLKAPEQGSITLGDGLVRNEIGYLPQQTQLQRDFPASVAEVVRSGCINQMRGRAIRVWKEAPNKTSNIWHLVCLKPRKEVQQNPEDTISEDYTLLCRRMEQFLGLHYTEDTIENGIDRLSIIRPPFTKSNSASMNRKMLALSQKRSELKDRWMRSLAVYDKMEVVNTNEIPDKYVTSVLFWDALRALLLTSALLLVGLIFALGTGFASRSAVSGVIGFFMALYTGGVLIAAFPKLFMLGSPLRRLKAFGNGILKALETQNLLEEPHCKVVSGNSGSDHHVIFLSGGSGRDKALFAQCVNDFFDAVDNQRYLLVSPKRFRGLNGFYVVPECFSKRKEDAQLFAKCMKPYIGAYDVVYTRNEKGRAILLEGKIKALANREERCIRRKKLNG